MSSMADEILSQVPISQLAARLGTDEATARQAAESALPALLAGMTAQAANPRQAQGLARALEKDHDAGLLEADDPLARVDPDDGSKIVGHVFGDRRGKVETDLQGLVGGDGGIPIGKLLPLLAPLVMSYFKKKMMGGGAGQTSGGGGLGDVLGGILGGGGSGGSGAGGGIGDILGSVFGGAEATPAREQRGGGGGIGDIIGGMLGKDDPEPDRGGGMFDDILDGIRGKDKKDSPLDDILGSILGR